MTPDDVRSISEPELAFGTVRFLPEWTEIPEDFRNGNAYTDIVERIFFGRPLPDLQMVETPAFDAVTSDAKRDFIMAHLKSFQPKHEHKIAGVGYLFSQLWTLQA